LSSYGSGHEHFAHSDLSGVALFEEAFYHGLRAAEEILAERGSKAAQPNPVSEQGTTEVQA